MDSWLWDSVSGSSDAGPQACVLLGMLPGTRERRQEARRVEIIMYAL